MCGVGNVPFVKARLIKMLGQGRAVGCINSNGRVTTYAYLEDACENPS